MELLFLWVEDFRKVQKQGFNFSAELHFHMEYAPYPGDAFPYRLNIKLNPGYVNLFDGNITNVTGIVGKNGSGKSTLIHCLKMLTGKLSTLLSPLVFSMLDRDENTIKTFYYAGGGDSSMVELSVKVEAELQVEHKFKIANARPYTIERLVIEGSKVKGLDFDFTDIACCFFSNTFDSHREIIYEGIHNVSTNYRVEKFLKEYIPKKEKAAASKKKEIPKIEIWPSHILQYHKLELRTLLKFLSYSKTRKSGQTPDLPDSLTIEFKLDDYEYLKSKSSFIYEGSTIEEIQKLAVKLMKASTDKRINFLNIVVLTSFYNALRKELFQPEEVNMNEAHLRIKELPFSKNRLFDEIRKLMSSLGKKEFNSAEAKVLTDFLGDNFTRAVQKMQFSDTDEISDNKLHYRLKIGNNLWNVLDLIFELKAIEDTPFIDYSWGTGLSTGQEAFLTHFARLYELKDHLGSKPIWLLIDEGDLYFHPDWQKNYFSYLVDYVNFLFPKNKVQIILTTHSPFIVSDLPRQNLIFLRQNATGGCSVVNNEIQSETFGGNIHELFTNTFFLSDGLMGEFARVKIEKLIQDVNDAQLIDDDKFENDFKSRIGIIGEPFIQAKLLELVAGKSDITVVDKIIEQRSNELKNLESIRRKRQDDQNRKPKS